jgi:preprotein translocase subunit SecB
MNPSVLQLEDLLFVRTRIDIDPEFEGDAGDFSFEGSKYRWESRIGHRDHKPLEYWVGVEYSLHSDAEKRCPYVIDMKAVGFLSVRESVSEDKRDALVYENGSALVFGAIREMIANITWRSLFGTLLLPTASFIGAHAEYVVREEKRKTAQSKLPPTSGSDNPPSADV